MCNSNSPYDIIKINTSVEYGRTHYMLPKYE